MTRSSALASAPNFHRSTEPSSDGVRVADQILDRLQSHGVDRIFGIPGGTISPLFDALLDHDIELVMAQHEAMAMYMAAGYATATGKPGVVAVTSGPGALNAVTGCASAHLDGVPMLLLVGEPPTNRAGRSPLQEGGALGLDLLNLFRSITRHRELLLHPHRAAAMVDQALALAQGAQPGPVLLQLPVDVAQRCSPEVQLEVSVPPPVLASPSTRAEIVQALHQARRPLILLGRGARSEGVAPRVLELAEYLRCPVATDIEAKGVFPESHPLSLGVFGVGARGSATDYLSEGTDLLLSLGCRLDDTTTADYTELLRSARRWIQVDADPDRLARSYAADLAVHSAVAFLLDAVLESLPIPTAEVLVDRDQALQSVRPTVLPVERDSLASTAPHDPRLVCEALQQVFPDACFTTDMGNHQLFASETLIIDQSDGFHVALGLAGMGSGIGTAIGLQLAFGSQRQVVSICGDGGLLMVGTELATCVRYRIPTIFAVFNDGALGMVKHGMTATYGRVLPWDTPAVDLVGLARSLGCDAVRLDEMGTLERVAATRAGGPLLLDIPILPEVRINNPRVKTCGGYKESQ